VVRQDDRFVFPGKEPAQVGERTAWRSDFRRRRTLRWRSVSPPLITIPHSAPVSAASPRAYGFGQLVEMILLRRRIHRRALWNIVDPR
jgi:hypothetical protein